MRGVECGSEGGVVANPFSDDEYIVSEDSRDGFKGLYQEDPGPQKKGNKHHGKRASLRNAAFAVMFLAEVPDKAIDNLEVLKKANVGPKDVSRHPRIVSKDIEKRPLDLVETFLDVSRATGDGDAVESSMLDVDLSLIHI